MSKIKEIWCMPHSHLDIGYTHPQPLLMELQVEYIDQAIEICKKTKDYPEEARFCWTIEATCVLKKWLKTASNDKIDDLKRLIKEKRVCVAALPMHTTPNCNLNEMVHMLADLEELRELLETDISVAINHDVNGQPWTLGQVMLDSGIDFYLTGINIHFGGIPLKRPASFLWEMSDGQRLHSFVGEHYSLFSQFLFTQEHSVEKMHEGVVEYVNRLEKNGYNKDFAFLTATNPPLYDNNSPDLELADLIKKYNEGGHEQKLRIVTAEMLRDKLLTENMEEVPVHKGDWTDYWNFGCGSTARETRIGRLAKQTVQKAEVVECFRLDSNDQYKSAKKECYENMIVFDEHTWGASQSVTDPECSETYSQLIHKIKTVYSAADLSGYLLGSQLERLCDNPHQSNQLSGIAVVNTSQVEQTVELAFPKSYLEQARQLSALRIKNYVPYLENKEELEETGLVTVKPFSYKMIPFGKLDEIREHGKEKARDYTVKKNTLITPFYQVTFDEQTGRIKQVLDTVRNKKLLDENREYSLFEPIRETIDEKKNPAVRATLFPRDVDLGNRSVTQWNHDWAAKREKAIKITGFEILRENYKVTFVCKMEFEGTRKMEQRISFFTYSPRIHMEVSFIKEPVYVPESIYFAVPLLIKAGWECSYDTAGEFVKLDSQQIGTVCRDWLTVDTGVSVYDEEACISLVCKDAPLVQVGDFNFGKESKRIERNENPLLLAWALNNYWDTNFFANQAGEMKFAYDLFAYEEFNPQTVLADAMKVENACVTAAMVKEAEGEVSLFEGEGNSSVVHVYPSDENDNVMQMILKNPTAAIDHYTVIPRAFHVKRAEIVSVQGKVKETIEIIDSKIMIEIAPYGFRILKLFLENNQ